MEKINKIKELEDYKKKLTALLASGTIALTAITGCTAKTNTDTTTSLAPSETSITSSLETTETTLEVTKDMATEDYMNHAKAVAAAMYEANKEYFDEKQFTTEDLENVYYVLNGKYFDSNKNILMERAELDRSFDIIRELIMPQRVNEMLQKFSNLEHGDISEKEYFDEVNASKFYDYRISLVNLIDVNEDNQDVRNFIGDYSKEMVKVTENIKNGVTPEEHLLEFFSRIRSAQTGDITDYQGINNYLQETTTKPGYTFIVAATYKAVPDYLNTLVDGAYINVPTKNGETEKVRIGYTYEENNLVKLYEEGKLVEDEDIELADKYRRERFQTKPFNYMCSSQILIYENFGFDTYNNVKTKTLSK